MGDGETIARSLREHFAGAAAPDLVSVYLFGSQARGQSHRESDVDVGVLLRPGPAADAARFDFRLRLTTDLIAALHRNEIDVVLLDEVPPLLARRIVLEGECVYCSDPEADHAFRRDVQLRAADLAPFIARTRRRKLEALRR